MHPRADGEAAGSSWTAGCSRAGARATGRTPPEFPFAPSSIDFVLSTHAHIDHSGLLPKLVKDGFRGPVHCTPATGDLLGIMLPDAGHIQEREAEWQTRKRERGGKKRGPPALHRGRRAGRPGRLRPVPYGKRSPRAGISAAFLDAGHILGSAIVVGDRRGRGDGRRNWSSRRPRPPGLADRARPGPRAAGRRPRHRIDVRQPLHKGMEDTVEEFVHAVDDTLRRKRGNVVIPAFAVGRAQDILYLLADLTRKGRLSGITLYIDSPLAAEATRITLRHPECYDDETREVFAWWDRAPRRAEGRPGQGCGGVLRARTPCAGARSSWRAAGCATRGGSSTI